MRSSRSGGIPAVPRSGDVEAGRPWSDDHAPRLADVTPEDLIERYPVLYHMAEDGTWPSIQRHGLLSTVALLDLFEAPSPLRTQVLGGVRRDKTLLRHPAHGTAVIRDQRPLKFLRDVVTPGTSEQEYLDLLNSRVYLWASLDRLTKLLGARAYRDDFQTVLHVDTARLLAAHPEIELAPYNTGSMHVPNAPKRGKDVFLPVLDYPHQEWAKKRGRSGDALVEVTVPYGIPDIAQCVFRVERWHEGAVAEVVFETSPIDDASPADEAPRVRDTPPVDEAPPVHKALPVHEAPLVHASSSSVTPVVAPHRSGGRGPGAVDRRRNWLKLLQRMRTWGSGSTQE